MSNSSSVVERLIEAIGNESAPPLTEDIKELLDELECAETISRSQLLAVARAKNGGKLAKSKTEAAILRNSKYAVRALSTCALACDDSELALRYLLALDGVRVPTASAILTWSRPARYAVIDVRAARAIERITKLKLNPQSVVDWVTYNDLARKLSDRLGISCMEVDRRLYGAGKR